MLLGTAVTITIADGSNNSTELFNSAFKEIEKVQNSFSLYNASSEISVINNNAYPGPVRISDDVFSLIKSSLEASGKTGGAFDITWASSGKLWDFSTEGFTPPDDIEIKIFFH
jgi:thiamine biosynthesis lipoprotein